MGWLDFFRKKETQVDTLDEDLDAKLAEHNRKKALFDVTDITTIDSDDCTGLYANANYEIKMALQNKDYDRAWTYLHKMQGYILDMAKLLDYTESHKFAFLAQVDEGMANVLRLEKKHDMALAHIIKAYIQQDQPTKTFLKKLPAYWKRAKLNIEDIDKVYSYIEQIKKTTGFETTEPIRVEIYKWQGVIK